MNFYKRFLGDYARKTAHLSLMEHGAYNMLLDAIYATERGLPPGYADLFRICRAMTRLEQVAVAKVADEFFPAGEDGMRHNSRASEEMSEAAPAIAAARANGKKGGRPVKPITHEKPSGLSKHNPAETQDEPSPKASQSQNSPSLRSGEGERAARLPKPFVLPADYREFCRTERPELDPERVASKFADYWHGKAGAGGKKLDWLATWRNWVRDERSPAQSRAPAGNKHSAAAAGIFGPTTHQQEVIDV